jgi:hypothetical protein
MAFRRMQPIRSKIWINNKTVEQTDTFNFFKDISYEEEKEQNVQSVNFVRIAGIIDQLFKPSSVSAHTTVQIYKTLARSLLSYDS